MHIDPQERRRRLAAVTRFERATREHEMKGCLNPDDWDAIDRRFLLAKAHLLRVMGFEVETQ